MVPGDGRMVLDKHRRQADFTLQPVARRLIGVNPNHVSWLGLIAAFLSGVVLYSSWDHHWMLILGAALVLVSGYFDALDGKIAKLAGRTTAKGDYLDHVFDRYADMFMIAAIAMSGWCGHPWVGLLAVIGVLLTSYMGTQAQAVGAKRLYDGLLGRADRIMFCFLVPILQFAMSFAWGDAFEVWGQSFSLMEVMLIYFAVVGNATAVQRAFITWRGLGEAERKGRSPLPADVPRFDAVVVERVVHAPAEPVRVEADPVRPHRAALRRGVALGAVELAGDVHYLVAGHRLVKVRGFREHGHDLLVVHPQGVEERH